MSRGHIGVMMGILVKILEEQKGERHMSNRGKKKGGKDKEVDKGKWASLSTKSHRRPTSWEKRGEKRKKRGR